ncbi:MAG: TIGR03435 family protein [Terriglobales bacterium]
MAKAQGTTSRAVGLALVWCCFVPGTRLACTAQAPNAFGAASVKDFRFGKSGPPAPFRTDPAGLHVAGTSLRILICRAYSIEEYQLVGGEDWTRTEGFSIDASTDAPASTTQVLLMLRGLLAQRFGLRLAHETRTTPVFALVVAEGGPKLRELAVGEQPMPGAGTVPPSGETYTGSAASIGGLLAYLNFAPVARALGRPVVDQTGLSGRYNIWLMLPFDPTPDGRGRRLHLEDVPSALRRQLGLELKPRSAAIDFYTIQSASKPTPN